MVKRRGAFVVTDPRADAQRGAECYLSALVSGHGPSGRGDACCGIIPSITLLSPASVNSLRYPDVYTHKDIMNPQLV
jgi:hypothetical protein